MIHPIIESVANDWFIVFSETPKVLVGGLVTKVREAVISFFETIDNEIIKLSPNKKITMEKFIKMNDIEEKILYKIEEEQKNLHMGLEKSMEKHMKDAYRSK